MVFGLKCMPEYKHAARMFHVKQFIMARIYTFTYRLGPLHSPARGFTIQLNAGQKLPTTGHLNGVPVTTPAPKRAEFSSAQSQKGEQKKTLREAPP